MELGDAARARQEFGKAGNSNPAMRPPVPGWTPSDDSIRVHSVEARCLARACERLHPSTSDKALSGPMTVGEEALHFRRVYRTRPLCEALRPINIERR